LADSGFSFGAKEREQLLQISPRPRQAEIAWRKSANFSGKRGDLIRRLQSFARTAQTPAQH